MEEGFGSSCDSFGKDLDMPGASYIFIFEFPNPQKSSFGEVLEAFLESGVVLGSLGAF